MGLIWRIKEKLWNFGKRKYWFIIINIRFKFKNIAEKGINNIRGRRGKIKIRGGIK